MKNSTLSRYLAPVNLAIATGLVYVFGYISLHSYLQTHAINYFEPFDLRYAKAGLLYIFSALVVLIPSLLINLSIRRIRHVYSKIEGASYCVLTVSFLFSYLFLISTFVVLYKSIIIFDWPSHIELLNFMPAIIGIISITVGTHISYITATKDKRILSLFVFMLSFVVVTICYLFTFDKTVVKISGILCSFGLLGWGAWHILKKVLPTTQEFLIFVSFGVIILPCVAAILFGVYVMPSVREELSPIPIQLVTMYGNVERFADGKCDVYIIYESSNSYYIVELDGLDNTIRISKSLVNSIVYDKDSDQITASEFREMVEKQENN